MNYRQLEVLCIAKNSVNLIETIAKLNVMGKYDADLALATLNQLIIEARMIMKGRGATAKANTETNYVKLGI